MSGPQRAARSETEMQGLLPFVREAAPWALIRRVKSAGLRLWHPQRSFEVGDSPLEVVQVALFLAVPSVLGNGSVDPEQ